MSGERIAALSDVPGSGTYVFRIESVDSGEVREAILLRTDEGVAAWLNYCQHLTHVRLDKGEGVPRRNGEIVCTNHGAMFDVESGLCTYGPCEGAYLNGIDLRLEGGDVYLDDPDYEFVALGPIPRDPADLTSTSNVGF